jgi:threonine synthase
VSKGGLKEDETVVALNTGLGIKYPNTVDIEVPILNLSDSLYKNV